MITRLKKYKKTFAFMLGSISVLALPPFFVFPILLLSLSSILLMLDKAENKKQAFSIGYWFGFGFYSFGFSWVGNALLIDYQTFGWLYFVSFLASGAFFGLFIAFPALLAHFNKNIIAKVLSFSAYIVIFEWLRSFIFTGFPWNLFGSTLAFSPITLQLASIIGTYGLSSIVIIFSSTLAILIKGYKKTAASIFLLSIIIVVSFGVCRINLLESSNSSKIKIRIVQPSIPQAMKWSLESLENNFNKYIEMSQAEGLDDVDFVIWGETATPFVLDMNEEKLRQITAAVPQKGYLITGLVRYELDSSGNYQPLNSMFIINKQGEIIDYYDKVHLVPFGEYIPFRSLMPQWIRPITNTITNFKQGSGFKKINIKNYPSFGVLICYEIIFPSQIMNRSNTPSWIINLTNDGWYGESSGPYQHLAAAQLRAVEEGITIVRVANSGISAVIDRLGQILKKIPLNEEKAIDVYLPQNLFIITIYRQYGNLIPLLYCFSKLIIAFLLCLKK